MNKNSFILSAHLKNARIQRRPSKAEHNSVIVIAESTASPARWGLLLRCFGPSGACSTSPRTLNRRYRRRRRRRRRSAYCVSSSNFIFFLNYMQLSCVQTAAACASELRSNELSLGGESCQMASQLVRSWLQLLTEPSPNHGSFACVLEVAVRVRRVASGSEGEKMRSLYSLSSFLLQL